MLPICCFICSRSLEACMCPGGISWQFNYRSKQQPSASAHPHCAWAWPVACRSSLPYYHRRASYVCF
jgi:hypothetical protein